MPSTHRWVRPGRGDHDCRRGLRKQLAMPLRQIDGGLKTGRAGGVGCMVGGGSPDPPFLPPPPPPFPGGGSGGFSGGLAASLNASFGRWFGSAALLKTSLTAGSGLAALLNFFLTCGLGFAAAALRSGAANLNSTISGNSGRPAGPRKAWREGVFDGQEVSTPRATDKSMPSSSGQATAASAALVARSGLPAVAVPIMAVPGSLITAGISSKSTLSKRAGG